MNRKFFTAVLFILLAASALWGYRTWKRRTAVDEFGRSVSLHPGTGASRVDLSAKAEDPRERASLPEYRDMAAAPVADLTPEHAVTSEHDTWFRSQGDDAASRYSSLGQITRDNVRNLKQAWIYRSHDGAANIQCTPVIARGVMYMPTAGNHIVAVDAANGSELWRFKPEGHPAQRGLLYWLGNATLSPRLFFTAGAFLYALDPQSGTPVAGFGSNGRVPAGGVVSPVVAGNVIVVSNWNVVTGSDLATGKPLWRFDVLGRPAAGQEAVDRGANNWGGMAVDTGRNIVYLSTGSPHPNFLGIDHPGNNEHANSVLALDINTGRLLWSFQEIRHDIWDLDIPAPPNLVSVVHEGKRVDAVAQVTKLGNTLLLDRVTGKPLFPYRLRRAPVSCLPGETTSTYQPVFNLPQPFARQTFTADDVTDLSPQAHAFVSKQIAGAKFGFFQPFEPGVPTVYYSVHGGAQWTGAAFDPSNGWLYVSANELPWIMTIMRVRDGASRDAAALATAGNAVYNQSCAACHGKNRKGTAMSPQLLGLGNRMLDDEAIDIIQHGRNAMPPIPVAPEQRGHLLNFLFDRDLAQSDATDRTAHYSYVPKGYPKLLDDQGYPGSKPPWGTLNAIDLNTGKIVWKVPLGEYGELTRRGIPKTGTENFGGASVTAGGLVFCAGTRDRKIRAFDKTTGEELWSATLPFGGFAPPAIYQVKGREYIVIAATGGGKLGGPTGDAYVAFSLQNK